MRRNNIYIDAAVRTLILFALSIAVGGLISLLCSCRTCRQISSVSDVAVINRADTVRDIRIRVDSVHVTDSVVTVIRGDTVLTDRWHREYRDRLRVDTVERVKWRTIYRTRTQTVTLTPRPTLWQRSKEWAGSVAILAAAVWLLVRIMRKLWKK